MNRLDMKEEGFHPGSKIIISETGEITGTVKPEDCLHRGVISMARLFGELLPSNHSENKGVALPVA